jgi:hypothetical protein
MQVRCKITDSAENVVYSDVVTVSLVSLADVLNDAGGALQFVNAELDEANGLYPWIASEVDGYACGVSSNGGVNNSRAEFSLELNLERAAVLSFWYEVWGEGYDSGNWYDYGALYLDGTADGNARLKSTKDAEWTYFELALTPGEHTLLWRFRKDGSGHLPGDFFAVRSVRVDPAWIAISSQPEDVTAALNGPYAFSVEALGDGLAYQWQYSADGGETWTNSAYSSATNAKLRFTANANWNGYKYRCVVTDAQSAAVTSAAVTLTVTSGD